MREHHTRIEKIRPDSARKGAEKPVNCPACDQNQPVPVGSLCKIEFSRCGRCGWVYPTWGEK